MIIEPLGVSGGSYSSTTSSTSGSGGSSPPPPAYPTYKVQNGVVLSLGKWVGQSLRKLILSSYADSPIAGRMQIVSQIPQSLDPRTPIPNALMDMALMVSPNHPVYDMDFEHGLITVLPGETLYIVVYDWYASSSSAVLDWSLTLLWEPLRR